MIQPLALVIGCLLIHLRVITAGDQLFLALPSLLADRATVVAGEYPGVARLVAGPRLVKRSWQQPWRVVAMALANDVQLAVRSEPMD